MFCEKCGAQLQDNAEFCTNCGIKIVNGIKTNEKIPDTEILLRVKPTFKFSYKVLPSLTIYTTLILFVSGIFMFIEPFIGIVNAFICFVILAIGMKITVAINKKQYDNCTYDFYKTKVIYKDNFLNVSEKEVKYKYIREVTMRQTFIQSYFNIGNIILFTNAETGLGNGIFIINVEDVNDVYRKIKQIIDI